IKLTTSALLAGDLTGGRHLPEEALTVTSRSIWENTAARASCNPTSPSHYPALPSWRESATIPLRRDRII
ncbi:unnamed protein product, partial [Ascophyllum nodosum]